MPNPLAILASIGNVAGQGAKGFTEGPFLGERYRAEQLTNAYRDIQNKMAALLLLQMQQEQAALPLLPGILAPVQRPGPMLPGITGLSVPQTGVPSTGMGPVQPHISLAPQPPVSAFQPRPGPPIPGPPTSTDLVARIAQAPPSAQAALVHGLRDFLLPKPPPPPLDPLTAALRQAQISEQQSLAALHQKQAGEVGKPKSEKSETETQAWARIIDRIASGTASDAERGLWEQHVKRQAAAGRVPSVHYATDAAGNMVALIPTVQPDGSVTVEKIPQGKIGKPQRAAGVAGGAKETVTTTERITPAKPITNVDEIKRLNQALPQMVNELSAKPGFNVPGAYVALPDGRRLRKEDILAQYVKDRTGIEIKVRWDGSRFTVVSAQWPEQRQPVETRRTTGPPRQPRELAPDEEE